MSQLETKQCNACNTAKPLDAFHYEKSPQGIYRYRSQCKACRSTYHKAKQRERRQSTPETREAHLKRRMPKLLKRYQGPPLLEGVYLKHCSQCKTIKPTTEFYADAGQVDGLRTYCAVCASKRKRRFAKTFKAVKEKKCSRCDITKPADEFLTHVTSSDGLTGYCRECHRERARENRRLAAERGVDREYIRRQTLRLATELGLTEEPEGDIKLCLGCDQVKSLDIFVRDSYSQDGTTSYCRECNNAKGGYSFQSHKRHAHNELAKALSRGDLIRPSSCEFCHEESDKIEAHHWDYSRPLDVDWVCEGCHKHWHTLYEFRQVVLNNSPVYDKKDMLESDLRSVNRGLVYYYIMKEIDDSLYMVVVYTTNKYKFLDKQNWPTPHRHIPFRPKKA